MRDPFFVKPILRIVQTVGCEGNVLSTETTPTQVEANGGATPFTSCSAGFLRPPFCALMTPTQFREFSFLWQLGRILFGLPAREF